MSEQVKLCDIAGFCPEEAVWKMLVDISDFLVKDGTGYHLNVDSIIIIGDSFMVAGEKIERCTADMIWELGAIAYYVATGHPVFGGHGRCYQQQHPTVSLPALPKKLQRLTPVVHRCLCYDASNRITMEELLQLAQENLSSCLRQSREKARFVFESINDNKCQKEIWPEEMKEV